MENPKKQKRVQRVPTSGANSKPLSSGAWETGGRDEEASSRRWKSLTWGQSRNGFKRRTDGQLFGLFSKDPRSICIVAQGKWCRSCGTHEQGQPKFMFLFSVRISRAEDRFSGWAGPGRAGLASFLGPAGVWTGLMGPGRGLDGSFVWARLRHRRAMNQGWNRVGSSHSLVGLGLDTTNARHRHIQSQIELELELG